LRAQIGGKGRKGAKPFKGRLQNGEGDGGQETCKLRGGTIKPETRGRFNNAKIKRRPAQILVRMNGKKKERR